MLSEILFDKEKYLGFKPTHPGNKLTGLSKINVFIGQNNSGKSRFLRALFSDETFEFTLKSHDHAKLKDLIRQKALELRQIFDDIHIEDADGLVKKISQLHLELGNFKIGAVHSDVDKIRRLAKEFSDKTRFGGYSRKPNMISTRDPAPCIPQINKIGEEITSLLALIFPDDFTFDIHKIYIPVLRGLRPIQIDEEGNFVNHADTYALRTIKDYFPNATSELTRNIFTGQNLYTDTQKLLLGNKEGREKIKKFELFLSSSFFQGQTITLIPDINNDVLLIGIGDEPERHVYELGDGIQMIIILLYPLFFNQNKNLLVFIEEPETSMHPGLQRLFIETLMKEEFRNFQFFFTTHSNHFLDITLDLNNISIYSFIKAKDVGLNFSYKIENTNNDDIRVLDLIGARSSAVFLSNCTIWVEGITDRLYLKRYLEVYQEQLIKENVIAFAFKEDLHYSFVEYGGGNIVHWSFANELGWEQIKATRISSKILLIADKDSSDDKPNSAKGKRLALLKQKLGERFLIIDGREIENTLHESTLIKAVKSIEKGNACNIIFDGKKIRYDRFKNQKLGQFIEANIKGLKRTFAASSGTILPKLEFCKVAVSAIESTGDLSKEALLLSNRLFTFITASNRQD